MQAHLACAQIKIGRSLNGQLIQFEPYEPENYIMEAERINAIGNQLNDLAQRDAELRRYL